MDRSSSAFSAITKSEERAGEKVEPNGYGHPWKIERALKFFSVSAKASERESQEKGIERQGRLDFRLSAFSYLSPFNEIRDHHNGPDPLLPDHAPEGVEGVCERTLRGDVRPRLLKPVDEVGIEVFATLLARKGPELDARVIV